MLLKRNLLESLTIVSCSGTLICLLLHCFTNISPISGGYLFTYFIATFLVSLFLSFKFVQYLLHLNKPLKYDWEWLEGFPEIFRSLFPNPPKRSKMETTKEYDTNELSVISTVLEKKLVSSWYMPYISQEIGFPFGCKQMLDQMIAKTFQICNKIETKDVYIDVCSILVTHLKEYRKALKRHEKAPNDSIENLYKKSHSAFNTDNKINATDHCTNVIRVILKELISWELWDTPHSELLVRILSKKLESFIDNTLANPQWLNDRLMTILKGKVVIPKAEATGFNVIEDIQEIEITEAKPETTTIESALSTLITKSTAPILHRAINEDYNEEQTRMRDIVEEVPVTSSEPVDIKSSPILRQRRGRQGRNEVKIYDRIIEGSVKTWETDLDLQCISLGQDLLASLDGELALGRLWALDPDPGPDGSPRLRRDKSPQPMWFGEEDAIDMEFETSPPKTSPVRKDHSPKPTDAILKDLQTTVHQAKTKIGDLQDEAAGMMEGLLDFGIAGLRKGLRFTGLSDDSQDKSPSHHKSERVSPATEIKAREREIGSSSVIQKDGNEMPTPAPPLLKQQRVISQDSLPSQAKPILKGEIPPLTSIISLSDSPEPEYEEAADLSTSIAKLRCLLSQRDVQRPEVWWAGEDTRSRSHDRPVDTATLADEYDNLSLDRGSPGQTSKSDGMQRLDKLFQRTVTGMFNSIKTAVGGEGGDGGEAPRHDYDWTYVCTSVEASVGGAVARLVGARRAHAHVDAALDSLSLAAPLARKRDDVIPDDFEESVWTYNRSWCGVGELVAAGGLLRSHVAIRLATVLCADLAEQLINSWLEDVGPWLHHQVFHSFQNMENQHNAEEEPLRELNLDETVAAVVEKLPATFVFGEEALTSTVRFALSSFSNAAINKDVSLRLLDILSAHFKMSAANRNPSFDAN
ncbi:uncharacterized protein LOC128678722 isoform X2 [Plodia interpunctella]|uniref:uncharacterized protein LOC128678722 isoform X2 n=1 Tax=Plodia interpunctella TaxID=58824 RepID=UPI0023678F05|nr:uncharacterized protein LOC128678722 isoform X2 [Plodia interpunctella]